VVIIAGNAAVGIKSKQSYKQIHHEQLKPEKSFDSCSLSWAQSKSFTRVTLPKLITSLHAHANHRLLK
jgi:hypothetical protein